MLFIEHYTVVCATVLKESYPLVEHCFILLQEATESKKDLNEKLKKNDTLAAELVQAIQIQTNIYCKSVERGRYTVYPTFGNLIFTILADQFFPPTLPGPVLLQFTSSGGGRGTQPTQPSTPTAGERTRDPLSHTLERRVEHPQPHLPWKVEGRLKRCIDAVAAAGEGMPWMENGKPACLTWQFKFVCSINCAGNPARNDTQTVASAAEFHRFNTFHRRWCAGQPQQIGGHQPRQQQVSFQQLSYQPQ